MIWNLRDSLFTTTRKIFGNASPLLIAWGAALFAMPIVQWAAGHSDLIADIILGVLLQASLVVLFLTQTAGLRRATLVVITMVAASWAFEIVGSKTGIPFGAYHYTEALQPQLLGVPMLIPLAWLMMLPPSVGHRATGHRQTVGVGLRGDQRAGVYRVGSVPGSADGTLGAVGLDAPARTSASRWSILPVG